MKFNIKKKVVLDLDSKLDRFVETKDLVIDLKEGELHILPLVPFNWDGCSPNFKIFGREFGVWDGKVVDKYHNERNPIATNKPETYFASLVHDAIYQTKSPFTRKEADALFLELLIQQKFKYAKLYNFFVRLFGWFWWKN